jgi:hypothetical protein
MPTPAKKKASSVSDWKKEPEPIELPSGKFMVVKNTSLSTFIQTGQIPNTLMSVVTGAVNQKKGKTGKDTMDEIISDPKALGKMFEAVDKFVTLVAIQPPVHMTPADESERDSELLYADEVEMGDKMYLFQRSIGGTTDLESFRRELAAGVDLVQQREDVELPPKRSPRSKRPVQ